MAQSTSRPRISVTELPPEILGEVFYWCTTFCTDAPIVLAPVCTTFRSIVDVMPRVWTRLRIVVGSPTEEREARKAQRWFKMSMACSVDLFVNVIPRDVRLPARNAGEDNPESKPSELIQVLRTYNHRISSLAIRSPRETLSQRFLDGVFPFFVQSLTALQQLNISIIGDSSINENHDVYQPASWFVILPGLRYLRLSNHSVPHYCPFLANLREASLVRPLRATPFNFTNILDLLRQSPFLLRLNVEGRIRDDQDPPMDDNSPFSSKVVLSQLTCLSIRVNNVDLFLDTITPPALSILKIDDLDGSGPERHPGWAVRGMVVRMTLASQGPGVSIKELSLVNVPTFSRRGLGGDGDEAAIWTWVFKRLTGLEKLLMIDGESSNYTTLLSLLGSGWEDSSSTSQSIDTETSERDNAVCPQLKMVSLTAPVGLDPSVLDRFKRLRTGVVLDVYHSGMDGHYACSDRRSDGSLRIGGFGFGSVFDRRRKSSQKEQEIGFDGTSSCLALVPGDESHW